VWYEWCYNSGDQARTHTRIQLGSLQPPDGRHVQPRLWRSRNDRVFAGVVGGLAERLDVDTRMLRWFLTLGALFTGVIPGMVIYVVLWSIMPARSRDPTDYPDGY
jgi:phage shock protein C